MKFNTSKQEKFIFKIIVPYLIKLSKKLKKIKNPYVISKKKKKFDPVTNYDLKIQKELSKLILKTFPNHHVEGEEGKNLFNDNSKRWIIDPIDGTKSFLIGMPTYSNLIGFEQNNIQTVGLAFFPELNKYYYTLKNSSYVFDFKKKKKLSTSKQIDLKNSKLVINTLNTIKNYKYLNFFKNYKNFFKISGADAYNYCRLAEGKIDIIIEANVKSFDIKPLIPIIENSGGILSDWRGNKNIHQGNIIVAANKILHTKIINLFKRIK